LPHIIYQPHILRLQNELYILVVEGIERNAA